MVVYAYAVCIASIFALNCAKSADEEVQRITPRFGEIRSIVSTTGTVQPRNRLEIKPSVNGRADSILVVEGQAVRTGQILAWMSSTERAALIDAARMQGNASLKYWEDAYKPIPIVSPIRGTVIVRAVEPGQTVTTTTAVLVLSDRLIVMADADETDIGRIRLGQSAEINLDAHPEITAGGRVTHISYESKTINNVTMYEVEITPTRVPDVFRSGMSANIVVIEKSKDQALLVPTAALGIDAGERYVLVDNGKEPNYEKRKVITGMTDDINTEILSGITARDTLIVRGQKKLNISAPAAGSNPFLPTRKSRGRPRP